MYWLQQPLLVGFGGNNVVMEANSEEVRALRAFYNIEIGNPLPCLGRSFVRFARSFAISFPGLPTPFDDMPTTHVQNYSNDLVKRACQNWLFIKKVALWTQTVQ